MSFSTPNAVLIQSLHDQLVKENHWAPKKGVASHWGISLPTLEKLLSGEKVRTRIIERVAARTGRLARELVVADGASRLPADSRFYEELRHGYFIDHARTPGDHRAGWHHEGIHLTIEADAGGDWKWFTGRITNQKNGHFEIRACLIQGQAFAILASNRERQDAFVASFSQATHPASNPGKTVICGIWSGLDHLSRQAVYRMFCSREPLTGGELADLLRSASIIRKFEDDERTAQPRHLAQKKPVSVRE